MILDPLNAITSVNFYRKVAVQRVSRTIGYLIYVALLFALAATAAVKVRLAPEVEKACAWLGQAMPVLTLQNGKMSSATAAPVTVRYPELTDFAFTVDTARAEPVTADILDTNKVIGYVTSDALYLRGAQGRVEAYQFAKDASPKPVVIDAAFYQSASRVLVRLLYPLTLVFAFLFTAVWKIAAALFYALPAVMINAMMEGGLSFDALFNIAAYAQTLVIALQAIFLFMPTGIPGFPVIALISTGVYTWLAIKRLKEPPAAPAA